MGSIDDDSCMSKQYIEELKEIFIESEKTFKFI